MLVDERHPDPSRVAAQVIVSPFHIVTLPRDDGDIRFNLPDPGRLSDDRLQASACRRHSRRPHGDPRARASSFTGLTPRVAARWPTLRGRCRERCCLRPSRRTRFVRFHAWQAVVGLGPARARRRAVSGARVRPAARVADGVLGVPLAGRGTGAAWIVVWGVCVVSAYKGRVWKLPLAGAYGEASGALTLLTARSSRLLGRATEETARPATASAWHAVRDQLLPRSDLREGCRLPALPLSKRRHVRGVVPAVPRIELQHPVERDRAALGMLERPFEIGRRHRLEQHHPPRVQRLEQRERHLGRCARGVGEVRPRASSYGLIVGLSSVSASLKRQ